MPRPPSLHGSQRGSGDAPSAFSRWPCRLEALLVHFSSSRFKDTTDGERPFTSLLWWVWLGQSCGSFGSETPLRKSEASPIQNWTRSELRRSPPDTGSHGESPCAAETSGQFC